MLMQGCSLNLDTPEEILKHLGECSYHSGFGLGNNMQLRSNGKQHYLRDYANVNNNRYITTAEALSLIAIAIK